MSKYGYVSKFSKDEALEDIDRRLNDLEFKASKNGKKPEISRAEKMLLMHHLGLLDKLRELNISNKKIAKLIFFLINASQDNIEGDLSAIQNPNNYLKTKSNFKFLVKALNDAGLEKHEKEAQKILDEIED